MAGAAPFAPSQEIPHAARWSARGAIRDLGTLDAPSSLALAINDAGTVAGWAETPSGRRPFRWTESTGLQPIGYYASASAQASDINAAGYIVGAVPFRQDGPDHAFLWTPRHGLFDLGTGGCRSARASRINDQGMVIGHVNYLPAYVRGFVWTRETGLIQIGTGAADSQVLDLNNQGQVVGSIEGRAMLWTRGAGSVDLNTRVRNAPHGLLLEQASAINDAGAIVARTNTGLVLLTNRPVSNLRPLVGAIQVPDQPRAGVLLSFSASFTDVDARDTHTAVWDWGDATTQAGMVSERDGKGSVSGQHAYGEGEFTIRLTVTDSSGKRTTVRWDLIVLPAVHRSAAHR